MLAPLTMTARIWSVAIAGLCLLLNGVSTETEAARTTVRPKPADEPSPVKATAPVSFAGDVFAFACTSVCGNAGKVLQCELKTNGECAKRYYVVCKGKDQCQWETVKGSCEDVVSMQDDCERLARERDVAGKMRRRSETGVPYLRNVGFVPALRRRFGGVRRRDLGDQQPRAARSGMAMTSGNGHAYALDNNNLVESHFGGPPVFSSRPDNDILSFPFTLISRLQNFNKPNFAAGVSSPPTTGAIAISSTPVEQPEASVIGREPQPNPPSVQAQSVNNWSGYQPVQYSPLGFMGHYSGVFPPQNGFNQAYNFQPADDFGIWGNRPRPFSPFTSFFNAVGLQDPMLLLQYLPVG